MRLLLEQVSFDPGEDFLWFVGDLINRGAQNIETIRFVMDLGDRATVVLGNHDLHFLAVAEGCHKPMRSDTFDDVLRATDLDDIIFWLRHLPLIHHDEALEFTMVHAGLPPIWNLATARRLANEVEEMLRSVKYRDFLTHMYGNEPDNWNESLSGLDRLKVITNYLTRLRFCKGNGQLELSHKEDTAPPGYAPWFQHQHTNHDGLRIVFGHWASLNGVTNQQHAFALDTGCVWGRELTMMCLDDLQLFRCARGG